MTSSVTLMSSYENESDSNSDYDASSASTSTSSDESEEVDILTLKTINTVHFVSNHSSMDEGSEGSEENEENALVSEPIKKNNQEEKSYLSPSCLFFMAGWIINLVAVICLSTQPKNIILFACMAVIGLSLLTSGYLLARNLQQEQETNIPMATSTQQIV